MIIKEITYRPFKISLKKPFKTAHGLISERRGFYLSIKDELGNTSTGEISPLHGFSKETIDEAEKELKHIINLFINKEFEFHSIAELDSFYINNSVPSVKFGFEQAFLNLLFQRNADQINSIFSPTIKEVIEINSVIDKTEINEAIKKILDDVDSGYKTVKIKVGRKNFTDDLKLVELVRNKIPSEIHLRLDSNGSWDIDTAYEHLQKLSVYNIQYIEDPCSHIDCMIKLSSVSPIPIALDLTTNLFYKLSDFISSGIFPFLVVKPMLIGSIIKLIGMINQANSKNIHIIISSAFETTVGRNALYFLAALTNHNYAHGLATFEYFQDNEKNQRLEKKGLIIFQKNLFPPKFELNL